MRRRCAPDCAQARGQAVMVMDADFEHPPELIPQLVAAVAERIPDRGGTAAGRRCNRHPSSAATSRLYYRVLDTFGDVQIEPGSADFMLLDRTVVDTINGSKDQDLFLRGAVRWIGYPIAKVSYRPGRRRHGDSKYSVRRMVELAVTGIVAHSVRPLRTRSGWRSALPRWDCCS